jgi:SAM-dependent methyltransferase
MPDVDDGRLPGDGDAVSEDPVVSWSVAGETHSARWRSERGASPPGRLVIADDRMTADAAYRHACGGTALLWQGDFQNARLLLQALARRVDRKARSPSARSAPAADVAPSMADVFHRYRQSRSQRARTLGMLLIPLSDDYSVPLKRAPDVRQACLEAYGPGQEQEPSVTSLRELLGLIGAHEWRRKGIEIPALGDRIHPHYGVFAPVRNEYVGLVAAAPLPAPVPAVAFDIGTGTGVLAAVLARRGIRRIVATEHDPRALACARANVARLKLDGQVEVVEADLFPEGRAGLIACNPPWIPARPGSPLEHAIYDQDGRMLRAFIGGLAGHLEPDGEGWLVLSDIAEHLRLRTRESLLAAFDAAGLRVAGRTDVRPQHPRVADAADPLHAARAAETTSLWRLMLR